MYEAETIVERLRCYQAKAQSGIHYRKEKRKMHKTVKIGTEFTFRREEFIFGLADLAWRPDGPKKQAKANETALEQIRAAGVEILNWVNDIAAAGKSGKLKKGNTILESVTVEPGMKKHDSPFYEAKKITLTLVCKGKGEFCKENWTVNFDLDPNCIELQAEPVPYAFYDRYKEIINALFFRRESCMPDPRWDVGGGGHISIDLATAFGNNLQCFRNFLVLYADAVKGDDPQYNNLKLSEDIVNAPFMHETGVLPAFIKVINALDQPAPMISTIGQLAHEINTKVYTKIGGTIDDPKLKPTDYPHYQALNLEHINIDARDYTTQPHEQRVEIRRLEAQRCVQELLDELQVLFGLLEESRSGKKYSMDEAGALVLIP